MVGHGLPVLNRDLAGALPISQLSDLTSILTTSPCPNSQPSFLSSINPAFNWMSNFFPPSNVILSSNLFMIDDLDKAVLRNFYGALARLA